MRFVRGFWGAMRREISRMFHRPVLALFAVFVPVSLLLFMYSLYGAGVPRELPIAVCDQDHTSLSRQVVRSVDATPSVKIIKAVADPDEGQTLIESRQVYGLIVIQSGCERDALKGLAPAVTLYYNNVYLMAGSLVYRDVRDAVGSISAGLKIANLEKAGVMAAQAKEMATPITLVQHRLFNPYSNYQYYLSAGFMPTTLQMFMVLTFILAMGFELKEGTAGEWLAAAQRSTAAAIMGKSCPYLFCFFLEGGFMLTMLLRYAGVPVHGRLSFILLALVAFIVACHAVAIFLLGALANMRFALTVGGTYTSLAFTFSGLTFPIIGMPAAVRYVGEIFPLTQYLRIFISQSLRGAPLSAEALPSICGLFLFLALPLIVARRWHALLREEKYWGGI